MENTKFKTAEELLLEESFLSWYHHKDDVASGIWNEWIAADSQHQLLADEAIRLLSQLTINERTITGVEVDVATHRLMRAIELEVIRL